MNPLPKSMNNSDEFLNLFYPPEINSHKLTEKTKISTYILKISSCDFDYENLYRVLGNASLFYALPRNIYKEINDTNQQEYVNRAKGSFKNVDDKNGEAGELLLYCFLETHLKAPKILSKMALKTSNNEYFKGFDGVHLLEINDGLYHLIFGESKMFGDSKQVNSSFEKAVSASITSLKKIKEGKGGINFEINLVYSHLMNEIHSQKQHKLLLEIIKPQNNSNVKKLNAFGIFIGFEIDISDWPVKNMNDEEFENKIKTDVKNKVEGKYEYIERQIEEKGLSNYHFYIYAIPFIKNNNTGIRETSKKIIGTIK